MIIVIRSPIDFDVHMEDQESGSQIKHDWIKKMWCMICRNCRVIKTEENKDDQCKSGMA